MGQKVHPTGVRVGIIKDWNAKWYADSKNFADYLVEDQKIRKFLKKKLYTAGVSKIEIERTAKLIKVTRNAIKNMIIKTIITISGLLFFSTSFIVKPLIFISVWKTPTSASGE